MVKPIGPKHTVIIDADLHVQDPHEIILSYFNTGNYNEFVQGEKKAFKLRLIGLFTFFIIMKFFFEERFTGFFSFALTSIIALLGGVLFVYGIHYFMSIMNNSVKTDGIRGLFYQIIFITVIVLLIGSFV
jgi:hypothetical protein